MIILNENLSLKVKLKDAIETNQRDFSVSFWDSTGTSLTEWSYVWKFWQDDVVLCASPAPWVKRVVKWFTISNNDTKTGKFILYVYNWNNEYIICQKSLPAGDSFDSLSAWWAWWGGWMDKALYDPDYIEANVFDMDNMIQWSNKQYVTPDEKTIFNSKQDALVSWSTIKTLNGESVLWEWNITLEEVSDQRSIVNKWHVAWELIKKWDFLYEDNQWPADVWDTFAPVELWKTWIPRTAQMIIWDWKYCGDLEVYMKKNRYPSNNVIVRLESDNNWQPSWQLVDLESTFETIYNDEVIDSYRLIKKKLLWNTEFAHWLTAWSASEWNHKWIRLKATEDTTITKIKKVAWCNATEVIVRVNNDKYYSWKFSDNVADVNIPVEEWDDIYISFDAWLNATLTNVAYSFDATNNTLGWFKIKSWYASWLMTKNTPTQASNTSNITVDNVYCRFVPNQDIILTEIKCYTDATHNVANEDNNLKIYDIDRKTVLSKNVVYNSSTHTYSFSPIYLPFWKAFRVHFPKVVAWSVYNNANYSLWVCYHFEDWVDAQLQQWTQTDYIRRPMEINWFTYYTYTETSINQNHNWWTDTQDYRPNYYNKWWLWKAKADMVLRWFKYRFNNAVWNFDPAWFRILSKDKTKELTHNVTINRWYLTGRIQYSENPCAYNYKTNDDWYFFVTFDPIELHNWDEFWIQTPQYSNMSYWNGDPSITDFQRERSWWPVNTTSENTFPKYRYTTALSWATYDDNNFYNLESISTTKKIMLENGTKYWIVFSNWAQGWEVEDPSDYFHLASKGKPFIDFSNKYYTWSAWKLNQWVWIWLWWLKDKTVCYRKIYTIDTDAANNYDQDERQLNKSLKFLAAKNPIVSEDDYSRWDMVSATIFWKTKAYKWLKPGTWYYLADKWYTANYLEPLWQRAQNNSRPIWYWTSDWHLFVQPADNWMTVRNAWTNISEAYSTWYTQTNSSKFVVLKSLQVRTQWWYRLSYNISETTPATSYYRLCVNGQPMMYHSHNSWTANEYTIDTFLNAWDIVTWEAMSTLSTNNARINNMYVRYATDAIAAPIEHNFHPNIWVKSVTKSV